jgi:probable rRNA maturation factor
MVILQKRVAGMNEATLDRFLARAKRAVGLHGAVTVLITTNRELRTLNSRFRAKDKPTDVLSFPAVLQSARGYAGDVAISAEIAAQNARHLGHSTADEVKILTLHGVLHLAGYDHEKDNGAMARAEVRLRKKLGLPVALIERAGSAGNSVRTGAMKGKRRRTGKAAGVTARAGRTARSRGRTP